MDITISVQAFVMTMISVVTATGMASVYLMSKFLEQDDAKDVFVDKRKMSDISSVSSSPSSSTDQSPQARTERHLDVALKLLPHPLAFELQPQRIQKMEYAVRGAVPTRAAIIESGIESGIITKPFDKLIKCNIGNPLALRNPPITFLRQVISAFWNPDRNYLLTLPIDVQDFVTEFKSSSEGSGGYTVSAGCSAGRKRVEQWLLRRDSHQNMDNTSIYLCNGASTGINMLLEILIDTGSSISEMCHMKEKGNTEHDEIAEVVGKVSQQVTNGAPPPTTGIFIPVPQYPLYSATIDKLGGHCISYYLDEECDWAIPTTEELDQLYLNALEESIHPKAIVLINPGNPTGSVMKREDIVRILLFAEKRKLVVFADEVYQDNIWSERAFYPFRRVMYEEKISTKLASFHSTSKGYYGECGVRGGVMVTDNFPAETTAFLNKLTSVSLCPNITGQIAMAAICSLPTEGEPSYPIFAEEREAALCALKKKAQISAGAFKKMEGVSCEAPRGALYTFPKICLPSGALSAAKEKGQQPDEYYCMQLLEETGIVCVPGSGFKQQTGTHHFRMTILPKEDDIVDAFDRMNTFHSKFLADHGGLPPSPTNH